MKQENDLVWINNVHLMLVPQYFKRQALNSTLGFFLHTPFANSDIFRMFPHGLELLKSLLCCDIIGF